MDPTASRAEAERSLSIAEKLLAARDLVGSKRFAELALDADPNLPDDRADRILAVADVLLASQKRINNHLDWYSILQIPHPAPNNPSSNPDHLLKCHYRRLSLLLHPDRNRSPGAEAALNLVSDAYAVLSDPSKRSLFDAELRISDNLAAAGSENSNPNFWTLCPSCCHVHQYLRVYENKMLRCQTCGRAFHAVELQAQPTLVPGTDMYYATWGFFPLGFSNPGTTEWKPFQSVVPGGGNNSGAHQSQPPPGNDGNSGGGSRGPAMPAGRNKKKTARKKVPAASGIKHRIFGDFGDSPDSKDDDDDNSGGGEEAATGGININEAAKGVGEEGIGAEDIEMIIDLDSTDEMLGNLHNLPFLKEEAINIRLP